MYQTQPDPRPERLPRYSTKTIGRAQAIDEIGGLLARSHLVTIVGPGGMGKTRIATEVARADGSRFTFVDLEPIRDPQLVVSTIAGALGFELQGTTSPEAALVTVLAQQSMLVVLDNCEHVLKEMRSLCRSVLASCPHVRMLATSREPLGVDGESVYHLQALDEEASVRLFIERAGEDGATFAKSRDDLAVVAEICSRLDGIPLAIELAAVRTEGDLPKALLGRLKERFRLLDHNTSESITPHHRTLRAMIDWGYDLLGEKERAAFLRLGVFSGEFSKEAARAVVGHDVDLGSLVRKSLLVASLDAVDRFRMLESMREYAILRLDNDDAEHARRAHAQFFADLAAQAPIDFGSMPEDAWLSRYVPDLDNMRAALSWLQRSDLTRAAAMLGDMKELWFHSNLSYEGLSRSQTAVASLPPDDDRALGPLLAVAYLAWHAGEFKVSYEAATRAMPIAKRTKDDMAIAQANYSAGWALFKLGDADRALEMLRISAGQFRSLNKPLRTLLAEIDYAIALKHADPKLGRAFLERALEPATASGWPRAAMRVETGLGEYAFLDGDTDLAIELGLRSIATARLRSSVYALAVPLVNTCAYLSIAGRHDEAREIGREAIDLGRSHGFRIVVEWALQSVAIGIAAKGDPRTAALILGQVDAFVDEVGANREPTEMAVRSRLFHIISGELSASDAEEIMRKGRALSVADACTLVFRR